MVTRQAGDRLLDGAGTPESTWQACGQLRELTGFRARRPAGCVVVVSPHPDDEVLGVGGTLVGLARHGAPVRLIAVTDGEASHAHRAAELRQSRPLETESALAVLGVAPIETVRLGLPDGALSDADVLSALRPLVGPEDLVLAPWSRDGHPDHDACGRAAEEAARQTGCDLYSFLVWAWHWAVPEDIPWAQTHRLDLSPVVTARKRRAARCFVTQLSGPDPILPPGVLRRLTRPYEILLTP